jgi:hypothetical protein
MGFSAQVRIDLHINGCIYPVAQAGGGRLIFDKPVMIPEARGTLVMRIDGQERRWGVRLQQSDLPQRSIAAELAPQ